jgi:hypothetical protein
VWRAVTLTRHSAGRVEDPAGASAYSIYAIYFNGSSAPVAEPAAGGCVPAWVKEK